MSEGKCFGTEKHAHCKVHCPRRINCIQAYLRKQGVVI